MIHYRKKDTKLKPIKTASLFLCIVAAVCAVIAYNAGTNYQLETSKVTNVSSGIDVLLRGEGMYNDTVYLTKDISISSSYAQFGSSEHPFEGVFDGRGHTIYIKYDEADSETSLFNYIAPGAVIRNVTFVYESVTVFGSSFGGVAKINDGRIENCKVVFNNLELTEEGLFSPLVTVNRGEISNVVVRGKVTGNVKNAKEDKVLYGGVCVYNKGSISAIVADTEYSGFTCTSLNEYNNGNAENVSISAVRYDDLDGGTTANAIAIIPSEQISSDYNTGIQFSNRDSVYVYTTIFERLLFEQQDWEIGDDDVNLIIKGKAK